MEGANWWGWRWNHRGLKWGFLAVFCPWVGWPNWLSRITMGLAGVSWSIECRVCNIYIYHLKLLTSGDPPTSASQSAGITGVSYSTQPIFKYFKRTFLLLYNMVKTLYVRTCNSNSRNLSFKEIRCAPGFLNNVQHGAIHSINYWKKEIFSSIKDF